MSDPKGDLTPYPELADVLANLSLLLRETRRARRTSMREAATQIGVSFSTIHRVEHGEDCALSSAIAVMRWLDAPASPASVAPAGTPASPLSL